jgi:hypothetical protein
MKFKGLIVEGKKEEYIQDLLNVSKFNQVELENMSFNDVLVNWCFYFKPNLVSPFN